MDDREKRTWAEVDLGAIEQNYRNLRSLLPGGCRFLGADDAEFRLVKIKRRIVFDRICDMVAAAGSQSA